MHSKIRLLFVILIIIPHVSAMAINEIFYDYPGADDDHEWIEVYNNGTEIVDLTGWKFSENGVNHNLNLILGSFILNSGDYAVIADDDDQFLLDYPNFSSNLIDSSFSLSNTGEALVIKNSSLIEVFNVTYFSSWGGDGNNMSICFINNNWAECGLTPGYDNQLFVENLIEGDYSSIKINEFLPDPSGYDNDEKPDGEFIELYNDGDEDFDLDKFYFKDDFDSHKVFISDTNTLEGTIIKSNEYLVIYPRYGSGFLNNDGYERLRFYDFNDKLLEEISYSNSAEGGSWSKVNNNWIQTKPSPNGDNIYNETFSNSKVSIETVYLGSDDKAKFGDNLRVKVNVYKGNSTKTSISLWIEDKEEISKRTKFNADENYKNLTLTVPLQLFPNCDGKFKDGTYAVVIEGLDSIDRYEINVEGITNSLCPTPSKTSVKSIDYDLVSYSNGVKAGEDITVMLLIRNNDEISKKYEAWSYVYSGSKSYSGDRELNKNTITIPGKGSASLSLKNVVNEEGEYKLKVKVAKEGRVTTEDTTEDIKIMGSTINYDKNLEVTYNKDSILYTSSSLKARRNAMLIFNVVLVLIILQFLIRKIL